MHILRPFFLSLLALAVLLTSLGMAMGRGAIAADGQLCSVNGTTAIVLAHDGLPLLDTDGEPVGLANPICPDCVIGALAVADRTALPKPLDTWATTLWATASALHVSSPWRMGGEGRGPPAVA